MVLSSFFICFLSLSSKLVNAHRSGTSFGDFQEQYMKIHEVSDRTTSLSFHEEDQFYKGYRMKFAAPILHKSEDKLVY